EDSEEESQQEEEGHREEEEDGQSSYPIGFLDDQKDWEHAEPPKSSDKMRNSIDFRKTMETSGPRGGGFLPPPLEPRIPRPVKTATHKFQPGKDWEVVKPMKRVPKQPVQSKHVVVAKKNVTIERRQGPKRTLSELVAMMREKEWENQQSAIEGIQEVMETNPSQVMPFCKEVWLNLIDLVASPRTMLANNALQFSGSVYVQFAQILAPLTPQFIVTLFNLTCSSHQFIGDGAASVLCKISEKSPRSRVFNSFIAGAKHRNPVARNRAIQCLAILVDQGRLEDDEMGNLIKVIVPLLRDTKSESREAARNLLKSISKDDRFFPLAQKLIPKLEDFKEMKRLIE
ncbi:MAG: hypothetical protein LBL27_04060, partial [Coriobacteriales bacterium]|nr:hypothetical protein [Coriobacteriales bacterium]